LTNKQKPENNLPDLLGEFISIAFVPGGDYFGDADAFSASIEADPNFQYAGNMHWLWLLVANCFEKLKAEGKVNASEADIVIETAYQDVVTNYTNGGNLKYALMRLGEINMERHKYATARAYFQRFLAAAHYAAATLTSSAVYGTYH
jgi:hypothetical protein